MANPENILRTLPFLQAVAGIQHRAEKQTDWDQLDRVFVRTDLFYRVQSPSSQLLLGRRGTGKTHLLRAFQKDAVSHGEMAVYLDCTRLGSGYSSLDLDPRIIAHKYFIAFLNQLGTGLLDEAARMERPRSDTESRVLSKLSIGLAPQIRLPSGNVGESLFNYRQIADSLTQILDDLGVGRLYLILDEWAHVPLRSQPYLAECLKRSILTVPSIALKVLAVNYQCQFTAREGGDLIGLERGADIPDVVDLDRYFVYDEQRDFVTSFFAEMLFNHLGIHLKWDLATAATEKWTFIQTKLFTQARAFEELVRAAEGNCRDFLCIFARAYFDEYRTAASSQSIGIPNIVAAATSWYDSEKSSNVLAEKTAQETMTFILDHVLKNYKSRTFLVESTKAGHSRLIRLLNERVLHKLNGTYSHRDRPGIRYDLFTVDYGAFVRFRGTVHQVKETAFLSDEDWAGFDEERSNAIPIDDKRSIRRITFDPDKMNVDGDRQLTLPGMELDGS